jgi:hypothetical protein
MAPNVRFASQEPTVREYATDTLHDRILTLKHAERGMLHLFKQTVDEIVETVLEHDEAYQEARSSTKTTKAQRATEDYKLMRRKEVIERYVWTDADSDEDSDDSIWILLGALGPYGSHTVKDILLEVIEAIESHELEKELYLVAMFVLRAGLESFIAQGHCATKCHTVLKKAPDGIKGDQKALQDACIKSHDRIEKALGIKDIRAFDKLLRSASDNKCSLLK